MRRPSETATLGVGLLVGAGLFDAEPLLVGGISITLLAVAAWAWVALAARGADIEREGAGGRVEEEEPLGLRLAVRARLALPGGEIHEPLLAAPIAVSAGRRGARVRVEVRFARRGRRELAPARLVVRDPLGLARRDLPAGRGDSVLVLPRIEPVRVLPQAGRHAGVRSAGRGMGADGIDPDGLRPYRDGAPAARIHWPALARGAGLLERRLAPDADSRPLIVLDPSRPRSEEALDAAVRAAASLCLHLACRGGCSILIGGERRVRRVEGDLGAWPAVWAALALVQAGTAPALGRVAARGGTVVYVTARALARPPAVLGRGSGRRVVVAPGAAAPPPRGRALLEVAGCRGYVLPPAARRAAA